jgi:hypothetical protein
MGQQRLEVSKEEAGTQLSHAVYCQGFVRMHSSSLDMEGQAAFPNC